MTLIKVMIFNYCETNYSTTKITHQSPFFKLIAVFVSMQIIIFLVTNKDELYLLKYYNYYLCFQ